MSFLRSRFVKPGTRGKSGTRACPRAAGFAALLAGALVLSACSSTSKVVKDLIGGGEDDTPLPGHRESIITSNDPGSAGDKATDPIVVPTATANLNWAQPGGVPSNSMQNLTLSRQLKRAFSIDAGAGSDSDGRLTASPIVVAGKIFVLDSRAVVRAFSENSGARVWKSSLVPEGKDGEGAFGGGLASDGQRIFATTAFGEVVALDIQSGSIAWRRKFDLPIRSAPTVAQGRIVFSTIGNQVHAISAADGTPLWSHQASSGRTSIINSTSPAISGGYAIVPTTAGEVHAISLSTGVLAWSDSLSGSSATSSLATVNDIAARPVVVGGKVIAVAHSGRLASFELNSGQISWIQRLSGTQTPWVAGDYIFMIAGRDRLAAVSRRNGAVKWWIRMPTGGVWSGPVMAGGRLLAVNSKGMLTEVSPQDGLIMNKQSIGDKFLIAPVVANGSIYFLGDDGTLTAMR